MKKRLVKLIAFLIPVILILMTQLPVCASSYDTAVEIDEAVASRDYYLWELEIAREQAAAVSWERDDVAWEYEWLLERSEEQRAIYEKAVQQKNEALLVMTQTSNDYVKAVEALEAKKEQYASRLRVMFEYSGRSMFDTFLEAESLQSFFTTVEFMKLISDADEQMIEELTAAREDADQRKLDAVEAAELMQQRVDEANALLEEIESDADMTEARIWELDQMLSVADDEANALAWEASRLDSTIAELQSVYAEQLDAEYQAELERQEALAYEAEQERLAEIARQEEEAASAEEYYEESVYEEPAYSGGYGFAWPVPSSYYVTSYYGWRAEYGSHHNGIDIAAPTGTPIVAAAGGVVIMAEWWGDYGNFVAVAHGNGYVTYYAHLSEYGCYVGQYVGMGEVIGYMGSTGFSTGPHLHFEIRESSGGLYGTAVNPFNFY
jgi:murein DD-endopeptidase MepM/ murein hydrolase activator NlpD